MEVGLKVWFDPFHEIYVMHMILFFTKSKFKDIIFVILNNVIWNNFNTYIYIFKNISDNIYQF